MKRKKKKGKKERNLSRFLGRTQGSSDRGGRAADCEVLLVVEAVAELWRKKLKRR